MQRFPMNSFSADVYVYMYMRRHKSALFLTLYRLNTYMYIVVIYRDNGESNNVVLESVYKHNFTCHPASVSIFRDFTPLVWGEVITIAI